MSVKQIRERDDTSTGRGWRTEYLHGKLNKHKHLTMEQKEAETANGQGESVCWCAEDVQYWNEVLNNSSTLVLHNTCIRVV